MDRAGPPEHQGVTSLSQEALGCSVPAAPQRFLLPDVVTARENRDMNQRLYAYPFADIYPLYVAKVERKGRTVEELRTVIMWLTGYDEAGLDGTIADGRDLEAFFAQAPAMTDRAELITGVVCGIRVEEIEDPLTQQIRWMDQLVDELARGKKLASILR